MSTTPRTDDAKEQYLTGKMGIYGVLDEARQIETKLAASRERVRVLREALENLRDEQNGAPLCTRETQWKEAMDKADAALAATKEDSK